MAREQRVLSPAEMQYIDEQYRAGKSIKDIADTLHVHHKKVSQVLHLIGHNVKETGRPQTRPKKVKVEHTRQPVVKPTPAHIGSMDKRTMSEEYNERMVKAMKEVLPNLVICPNYRIGNEEDGIVVDIAVPEAKLYIITTMDKEQFLKGCANRDDEVKRHENNFVYANGFSYVIRAFDGELIDDGFGYTCKKVKEAYSRLWRFVPEKLKNVGMTVREAVTMD